MPAAPACRERVQLRLISERPCFISLREPKGEDELSVGGVDTPSAVALLGRLLADGPDVAELAATDRDRLLAALHRFLWGDRIAAPIDCPACEGKYDLVLELSALQRMIAERTERARVIASRTLEDRSGQTYRLPSADEECAAADLGLADGQASLATQICGGGQPEPDLRLEQLAPLIDVDLEAACAECGAETLVRFDIQSFVLQRLLDERQHLLAEIDALAAAFNWTLSEILSLPRSIRRAFAERLARAKAFA